MNCGKCGDAYDANSNRCGSYCPSCKREYQREWYKTSKCNSRKAESVILSNAKQRAKKRGVDFNLDLSDIIIPKRCPALGVLLSIGDVGGVDNSPSLDRIISSKGYVKGNVAVISTKANRIKSNATHDEIKMVHEWLASLVGVEITVNSNQKKGNI